MSKSLWTEEDQKALVELVSRHGFAGVALGLRQIAYERNKTLARTGGADWLGVAGLLTRIYDHIAERRSLHD